MHARTIVGVCLLGFALAGSATQARPAAGFVKSAVQETDVTGGYFAVGKWPREFAEIELLSLATIDENAKPAPLNGFIRPKRRSAKDYKLIAPKLSGKNLTFTTTTVNGVSYSFTGAFVKLGNFPADPPNSDDVVLSGTLTKLMNGKPVAETKVGFTYSAGG